jgi:DNA-binding NarL/FixJ family response regulator
MHTTNPLDNASCEKSAARPRILIVEDDMGMGRALALTLKRVGGEATVVGTIGEARKLLAQLAAWDGLILDLCLPDGPGLDVLAWVRAKGLDFPVLIHTGHSEHDAINGAFDLHAWYLDKPSTAPQIERFVRFVQAGVQQRSARPRPIGSEDLTEDLRRLAGSVLAAASHLDDVEVQSSYHGRALAALRAIGGVQGTVFVIDRNSEQVVWASEPTSYTIEGVVVAEVERALKTNSRRTRQLLPDGGIVSVVPLDDGSMFGSGRYAVAELEHGGLGRGPVSTLSGREWEVAQLLADGYSQVNIGARCELAASTVRTHVRRIYAKLGICNRADLVRELLRPRGASAHCAQARTRTKRPPRCAT